MRESVYQAQLIKRIKDRFPGCFVEKSDAALKQGIPDITVFLPGGMWAKLEIKVDEDSPRQPNQDFYIKKFNDMCFAAFIHPKNEEAILNDLQQKYESFWEARIS
jgi:hypothetical protein